MKKVNCAMLPLCEKSLSMKVKRSNLIAMMWNRADQLEPAEGLDPEDFGFKLDNDTYMPIAASLVRGSNDTNFPGIESIKK